MSVDAQALLVEAGILPEVLPDSFTFNKVREVLGQLKTTDADSLREAVRVARGLKIRGPLQTLIFVKHHLLDGAHEVEVDRVEESEDGAKYAVLVYPEGELPLAVEGVPEGMEAGVRLHYDPAAGRYGPVRI